MKTSRAITATLTLTVALAVAGCSSDNTPTKDPSTPGATSTETGTATPSASNEPEVPSDWQTASVGAAQLQVPSDWRVTSDGDDSQTIRAPKDAIGISPGFGNLQANVYRNDGTEGELEELADLHEKDLSKDLAKLKRLPNETINGSLFFHFLGETENKWQDVYGTLAPEAGDQVTVTWDFNKADIDRKGSEALITQIMPTYKVL